MNPSTFEEANKTYRYEFLRLVTSVLISGHTINIQKTLCSMSISQIARSIKIPEKQVSLSLVLHSLFIEKFGPKPIERGEGWESWDGDVVMNPRLLQNFLSEPAVLSIASEVASIPEEEIRDLINQV